MAYETLEVIPAAICASLSVLSSQSSVSLATAGVPLYFDLQLKDSWGNPGRLHPSSNFAIVLAGTSFSQTITGMALETDDSLSLSLSPSISSTSDLNMPGGLTATYYSDSELQVPAIVTCHAGASWRNPQHCGSVDVSAFVVVKSGKIYTKSNQLEIGSAQSWSVRYKGTLRTTQSGNYTFIFHKALCEKCSAVFVLNDTSTIFNKYQSPVSLTVRMDAGALHSVIVRYQFQHSSESIDFRMTYSYNSEEAREMPTINLFPLAGRFVVKASPQIALEIRAEAFLISNFPALTATFYSDMDFQEPFRVQEYSSPVLECGDNCMPLEPVHIRWTGFYKESAFSTVSVLFGGSFCHAFLKLWLDGILYADLSQPMSGGDVSRYINFRTQEPSSIHDLRIEYSKLGGNALFSLKFTKNEYSNSLGFLYSRSMISSIAGTIQVMSAAACASRSTLTVETGVATAGHTFSAIISVSDSFGNAVNDFVAPSSGISNGPCSNFTSMSQPSTGNTTIIYIGMNLYNVTAQVFKLPDERVLGSQVCLRVCLTPSDFLCLNYTMRVFPDQACASMSSVSGSCLTLGAAYPPNYYVSVNIFNTVFTVTAGIPCLFSIVARDRFGNLHFQNSIHQDFFYLGHDFTRFSSDSIISSGFYPSPVVLSIRASVSGQRSLSILHSNSRGVFVEYFSHGMHWSTPIYSGIATGILPEEHYSWLMGNQSLLISKYSRVAVRWTGFLRVLAPQLLTFVLNASGSATLCVPLHFL